MSKPSPFKMIQNLNDKSGGHYLDGDEGELYEKAYSPFIINRGLGMHEETVIPANQMNMHPDIPARWQYDFFFYGLRAKKRWGRWAKRNTSKYQDAVKKFFGYSNEKAKQAIKVLQEDQLKEILEWYNTSEGGKT